MGDVRYDQFYSRVRDALDPVATLRALTDEEVVAALAAASRRQDPYWANVFATEAMNRSQQKSAIVGAIAEGVYAVDRAGRITHANPAAERMSGWSHDALVGRRLRDVLQGADAAAPTREEAAILGVLDSGTPTSLDKGTFLRADGDAFPVDLTACPILREGEVTGAVVVFRDATARLDAERRRAARVAIGQAIAGAATAEEAARAAVRAVAGGLGWAWGAYWALDAEAKELRLVASWSSEDLVGSSFERESLRLRLRAGEGLAGRVFASARAAWLADAPREPTFARRASAEESGLRCAVAFPVHVGTDVLGVVELLGREPAERDEDLAETLSAFGGQLGQFLERKRAEASVMESEARKASVLASAPDALVTVQDGVVVEFNPAAERLFGVASADALGRRAVDVLGSGRLRRAGGDGVASLLEGSGTAGARVEMEAVRPDGAVVPVEFAAVRAPAPAASLFTLHVRDLTDRKRWEGALRAQLDRLRAIHALSDAASRAEALGDIYEQALGGILATLAADRASILLADEDGVMRFRAWRGLSEAYRAAVDGHSPWRPTDASPQPIVIADVATDPSVAGLRDVVLGEGIRALAFIPLTHAGRLFGKFMVYYDRPRRLDAEDLRTAGTLAKSIASAIYRQRAEEERRRLLEAESAARAAAEAAERRATFLAEASRVLSSSLDHEDTLASVARLAVPELADRCVVHVLEEDGAIRALASDDDEPAQHAARVAYRSRYPPRLDEAFGVGKVLRTGEPDFAPDLDAVDVDVLLADPERAKMLRALGVRSVIIVPLASLSRTHGTLTLLATRSGRRYSGADLELAEDLGRRAGLAIENSRLYAANASARAAAERAADRTARLQALTAALAGAATEVEVGQAVVREGCGALGAVAGCLAVLDDESRALDMVHAHGLPAEVVSAFARMPMDVRLPATDAVRTGEPVFVGSIEECAREFPAVFTGHDLGDRASWAAAPLLLDGRAAGAIAFSFRGPSSFGDEDRELLLALARLASQALERGRLFDAERESRARAEAAVRERDATLAALAESEGRRRLYAEAFANSTDAIALIDAEGRYLEQNEAHRRLLGYADADLAGRTPAFHMGDEAFDAVRDALAASGSYRGELSCRRRDGEVVDVELSAFSMRDEAGNVLCHVGFKRDVTARRRAADALRASEERYQLVSSVTREAIWDWDVASGTLSWNDNLHRMFGYEAAEIEPTLAAWRTLIHPEDRERVVAGLFAAVDGGDDWRYEYRLRRKDGSFAHVLDRGRVLRGPQGRPVRMVGSLVDVTERRRQEDALRESEARHRILAECSSDMIALYGPDGVCRYVSPACRRLLGFEPEDLVGRSALDFIHPDDRPAGAEVESAAWAGADERRAVFRRLHRLGHYVWVETTAGATRDPVSGDVLEVVAVTRDATARKQAEAEARERERRLAVQNRILVDLAASGAVEGGGLREALRPITEAAAAALGVPRVSIWLLSDDGAVARCEDLFDARDGHHDAGAELTAKAYPRYFEALMAERTIAAVDARLDHRTREFADGYLALHGITTMLDAPIRGRGRLLGVVCHEDVGGPREWSPDEQAFAASIADLVALAVEAADRRRAEDDLRRSELWLRTVFDSMAEAVLVLSYPGRVILGANRAAERMFGHRADELLGETTRVLHVDVGRFEQFGGIMAEAFARGDAAHFEFEMRRKDGSAFATEHAVSLLQDPAGGVLGVLSVVRDVTERKRAEERARELNRDLERRVEERTRELAAANRELEAFSYTVSHDLRTPLRAIDYLSRATLEEYGDSLGASGREYLDRLHAESQRLTVLVNDLLTLSRRVGELQRAPVDITRLARDVASGLARREPDRSVEVVVQDGLVVAGDERLLRAVLENLLGNAWKFTSHQPHARIEVGRGEDAGSRAFFVRDDGPGFDPAQADRLFRPFERLHAGAGFEGTGIGLATVRRIVERHGGRVWATSRPGDGACFWFTL